MDNFILTTKIQVYTIEACDESIKKLIETAKFATANAYAPYSKYNVGAAALLKNGIIVSGNNQENAAYPSGLCAERTTLFYANAQYPDTAVEAIAIAAYHNGAFTDAPCSPCGSCRQVLLEIENRFNHAVRIIMYGADKIYEVASIKELLPLGFEKESLSK